MVNDNGTKISLYHNLFQVFLILSLVFLAMAVVLFFLLDMRSTLGYLTGRHAKKRIKELEASTAVSGRLMQKQPAAYRYVSHELKLEQDITALLNSKTSVGGTFVIVREMMLIHTEETI